MKGLFPMDDKLNQRIEKYDSDIAELQKKLAELKAKKKKILAKENEKARKERTRRLIKIGAEFEACMLKELTDDSFESEVRMTVNLRQIVEDFLGRELELADFPKLEASLRSISSAEAEKQA